MPQLPAPYLNPDDCVVLYDGVCKLCNGWAKFIIRHDRHERIRLATVQSQEGQALLRWAGLPLDVFDSLVVIEHNQIHLRSAGVFQLMHHLPWPWRWLGVLRCVPRRLRDWAYDRIARNRYRLFGRHDHCLVLTPDHQRRFLKADHD